MLFVGFPLSLRKVEDLLQERGVYVSYKSVRYWWHKFGSQFANQIKKRSAGVMQTSNWRWRNGQRRDVLARLSDTTATCALQTRKQVPRGAFFFMCQRGLQAPSALWRQTRRARSVSERPPSLSTRPSLSARRVQNPQRAYSVPLGLPVRTVLMMAT